MVNPSVVPKVTFNNGHQIPIVGLGTWQSEANGAVYKAVKGAIENGYRHIDCAHIYQNQEEIGQALTDVIQSGVVKREELFITSKVWLTFYRKDRVAICVKKILADLKLEYIDLILLHWPFSFQQTDETLFPVGPDGKILDGGVDYLEAYKALEPLVEQGLIKSIGISNFTKDQVERVVAQASIKPVTNQVECHPYLNQEKLRQACQAHGIVLTAYSPLGNPGSAFVKDENRHKLLKDEVVTRLAAKYGKNAGQILIKFQVQRGIIVIPKSVTLERIVSNIDIFDFELTKEELDELLTLNRNYRSCNFDATTELPQYPFKPEIEY